MSWFDKNDRNSTLQRLIAEDSTFFNKLVSAQRRISNICPSFIARVLMIISSVSFPKIILANPCSLINSRKLYRGEVSRRH